jgi:hypothetical protein
MYDGTLCDGEEIKFGDGAAPFEGAEIVEVEVLGEVEPPQGLGQPRRKLSKGVEGKVEDFELGHGVEGTRLDYRDRIVGQVEEPQVVEVQEGGVPEDSDPVESRVQYLENIN